MQIYNDPLHLESDVAAFGKVVQNSEGARRKALMHPTIGVNLCRELQWCTHLCICAYISPASAGSNQLAPRHSRPALISRVTFGAKVERICQITLLWWLVGDSTDPLLTRKLQGLGLV